MSEKESKMHATKKNNFTEDNKIFKKIGYCKINQVFKKDFINKIKKDINKIKKKGSYKDKFNKLRRIEKIYNKTKNLKKLNTTIKKLIFKILRRNLEIFKDKCNLKPSGGAGFKAHYDGTFYFVAQSAHRYIDRASGMNKSISLDTGIFLLDSVNNITKFFSIPDLTDINSILYLKNESI